MKRDIINWLCGLLDVTITIILPFLIMIAAIASGINAWERHICSNYSEVTGKETRYMNFDSCYVNTDHGFQKWDEYTIRAAASEGLSIKKED